MTGEERTALIAFITNIGLFLLKIAAALSSGSMAVLSSAFDSLNDIISYFIGYYSVKQANKGPDEDHPFGHRRMEPLAGIIIAIFAGILAFEILKTSVMDLFDGKHELNINEYTFLVLIITISVKLVMYLKLKAYAKKSNSSAFDAMAMDSKNDVLSNAVALIGVAGAFMGQAVLDDIAAIVIALYIARSGYLIAKKNFDYIVGAKPSDAVIEQIRKKAKVAGVKTVSSVRAHYVGDRIHAEIIIVLEKRTMGPESHDIATRVQKSVESVENVSHAFIHIDYE